MSSGNVFISSLLTWFHLALSCTTLITYLCSKLWCHQSILSVTTSIHIPRGVAINTMLLLSCSLQQHICNIIPKTNRSFFCSCFATISVLLSGVDFFTAQGVYNLWNSWKYSKSPGIFVVAPGKIYINSLFFTFRRPDIVVTTCSYNDIIHTCVCIDIMRLAFHCTVWVKKTMPL